MSKYTLENRAIMADGQEIARHDAARNVVVSSEPLHHKIKSAISRLIEPNPQYIVVAPVALDALSPGSDLDEPPFLCGDAPAKDPALGDKTPAYVEWFRRNHSAEEFADKYRGRKLPVSLDDALAEPTVSNHMPTNE